MGSKSLTMQKIEKQSKNPTTGHDGERRAWKVKCWHATEDTEYILFA